MYETIVTGKIINKSGTINGVTVYLNAVKEQNSITEILTEIDTEIKYLEKQLTKAKSIKQGMIQQLLTGKIRLV